jgi:hypothetical protein
MCTSGDKCECQPHSLDLLTLSGTVAKLELKGVEGVAKGKPAGTLSVCLTREVDPAASALEQAQRDVAKIKLGPASTFIMKTAGMIENSPSTVEKLQSGLANVSAKIKILVSLGDEIAKVRLAFLR